LLYARNEGQGMRDIAQSKGLIFGSAAQSKHLELDKSYADVFSREVGLLVPEKELKWHAVHPSPDRFDFGPADWLLHFAQQHDMLFRGHTLAWHVNNPGWLQDTLNHSNARQILVKHIQTVVGHYAGKAHSWDVVNEVIQPSDGLTDGLRENIWLSNIGPEYMDIAFRAAAEADPKALLFYNETNLDYEIPEQETKRQNMLKLLSRLKSAGVPVQGLGIQAHLRGKEAHFNPKKMLRFVRDVAGLGLKIMVTEMDVSDQGLPPDPSARDREVAKAYYDYLSTILQEKAVLGVITWGVSDRYTWVASSKPRKDARPARPLLLDANLGRKLAWEAMAKAIEEAPSR